MAKKKLEELCEKAFETWNDLIKISIRHKVGDCPVGEDSVIICVSSAHRKEGLNATEYLINTLKEVVPIWKKEKYSDGTASWKENCECNWSKKRKMQ